MAILGILSGCRSASDLESNKAPCDSTSLYLFEKVELEEIFWLLRQWMLAPDRSSGDRFRPAHL